MTVKTIKEHINNLTLEADAVIRFGGPHSEAYLSGMQKSAFIFIPMPKKLFLQASCSDKNKITVKRLMNFLKSCDEDMVVYDENGNEILFTCSLVNDNHMMWLETEQDADMVLTYMARMIQEAKSKGLSLKREAFQESGRRVTLFNGVREWFSRINRYGEERGIRILHYINSSGLKEIIEGTEIAHEFRKIYACSFLYDVDGIAYWPAVAVNYTNKTQFIFKINKGVESVFDSKLVNRYIPENERPVPFKHMIYVGDGTTDIPCMRLVKNSGGHSIAVYNPDRKGASKEMASLIHDNRVSHVCPADYTEGSEMDILVKTIIDKIDLDDRLEKLEVVR